MESVWNPKTLGGIESRLLSLGPLRQVLPFTAFERIYPPVNNAALEEKYEKLFSIIDDSWRKVRCSPAARQRLPGGWLGRDPTATHPAAGEHAAPGARRDRPRSGGSPLWRVGPKRPDGLARPVAPLP